MPSLPGDEAQHDSWHTLDALEEELLALGRMPRQGEQSWEPEQWSRYASIVTALVARLAASDASRFTDLP